MKAIYIFFACQVFVVTAHQLPSYYQQFYSNNGIKNWWDYANLKNNKYENINRPGPYFSHLPPRPNNNAQNVYYGFQTAPLKFQHYFNSSYNYNSEQQKKNMQNSESAYAFQSYPQTYLPFAQFNNHFEQAGPVPNKIRTNFFPSSNYLIRKVLERLSNPSKKLNVNFNSYMNGNARYDAFWNNVVNEFVEGYIENKPELEGVLQGREKFDMIKNYEDVITSFISFLKSSSGVRLLGNNVQLSPLITDLANNKNVRNGVNILTNSADTVQSNIESKIANYISWLQSHGNQNYRPSAPYEVMELSDNSYTKRKMSSDSDKNINISMNPSKINEKDNILLSNGRVKTINIESNSMRPIKTIIKEDIRSRPDYEMTKKTNLEKDSSTFKNPTRVEDKYSRNNPNGSNINTMGLMSASKLQIKPESNQSSIPLKNEKQSPHAVLLPERASNESLFTQNKPTDGSKPDSIKQLPSTEPTTFNAGVKNNLTNQMPTSEPKTTTEPAQVAQQIPVQVGEPLKDLPYQMSLPESGWNPNLFSHNNSINESKPAYMKQLAATNPIRFNVQNNVMDQMPLNMPKIETEPIKSPMPVQVGKPSKVLTYQMLLPEPGKNQSLSVQNKPNNEYKPKYTKQFDSTNPMGFNIFNNENEDNEDNIMMKNNFMNQISLGMPKTMMGHYSSQTTLQVGKPLKMLPYKMLQPEAPNSFVDKTLAGKPKFNHMNVEDNLFAAMNHPTFIDTVNKDSLNRNDGEITDKDNFMKVISAYMTNIKPKPKLPKGIQNYLKILQYHNNMPMPELQRKQNLFIYTPVNKDKPTKVNIGENTFVMKNPLSANTYDNYLSVNNQNNKTPNKNHFIKYMPAVMPHNAEQADSPPGIQDLQKTSNIPQQSILSDFSSNQLVPNPPLWGYNFLNPESNINDNSPLKSDCKHLDDIAKNLKNNLNIRDVIKEKDNLMLLFRILRIFILRHKIINEPLSDVVAIIGRNLLTEDGNSQTLEKELEIGREMLENEFERGDFFQIFRDIREEREKDLTSALNRLILILFEIRQTLIIGGLSNEAIKLILQDALSMSVPKLSFYFIEECKKRTSNFILTTLTTALNFQEPFQIT